MLSSFVKALPQLLIIIALSFCGPALAERELASQPETREIHRLLNTNQARAALEKAKSYAKANDASAEAHYWLGAVSGNLASSASIFSAPSLARQAKTAFERAAALDAKHIEARVALVQFHLQAPGIVGGDDELIPGLIAQITAINPGAGLRAQALVKMTAEDFAGAQPLYLQALALDASDADAISGVVAVAAKTKQYQVADVALKKALAQAPESAKLRYQAGKLAALSGSELAPALAHLDALLAQKLAPAGVSVAGLHFRRGQILAHLGRKPEAISALERALQVGPSKEVTAELARLRKG